MLLLTLSFFLKPISTIFVYFTCVRNTTSSINITSTSATNAEMPALFENCPIYLQVVSFKLILYKCAPKETKEIKSKEIFVTINQMVAGSSPAVRA